MTPAENIRANAEILRAQKAVPEKTIDAAEEAALRHAMSVGALK